MSCKGCNYFYGDDDGNGYCKYGNSHGDISNYRPDRYAEEECKDNN